MAADTTIIAKQPIVELLHGPADAWTAETCQEVLTLAADSGLPDHEVFELIKKAHGPTSADQFAAICRKAVPGAEAFLAKASESGVSALNLAKEVSRRSTLDTPVSWPSAMAGEPTTPWEMAAALRSLLPCLEGFTRAPTATKRRQVAFGLRALGYEPYFVERFDSPRYRSVVGEDLGRLAYAVSKALQDYRAKGHSLAGLVEVLNQEPPVSPEIAQWLVTELSVKTVDRYSFKPADLDELNQLIESPAVSKRYPELLVGDIPTLKEVHYRQGIDHALTEAHDSLKPDPYGSSQDAPDRWFAYLGELIQDICLDKQLGKEKKQELLSLAVPRFYALCPFGEPIENTSKLLALAKLEVPIEGQLAEEVTQHAIDFALAALPIYAEHSGPNTEAALEVLAEHLKTGKLKRKVFEAKVRETYLGLLAKPGSGPPERSLLALRTHLKNAHRGVMLPAALKQEAAFVRGSLVGRSDHFLSIVGLSKDNLQFLAALIADGVIKQEIVDRHLIHALVELCRDLQAPSLTKRHQERRDRFLALANDIFPHGSAAGIPWEQYPENEPCLYFGSVDLLPLLRDTTDVEEAEAVEAFIGLLNENRERWTASSLHFLQDYSAAFLDQCEKPAHRSGFLKCMARIEEVLDIPLMRLDR